MPSIDRSVAHCILIHLRTTTIYLGAFHLRSCFFHTRSIAP